MIRRPIGAEIVPDKLYFLPFLFLTLVSKHSIIWV